MKTRLQPKRTGGFTLIESLFAAMLIGLVIAALAVSSGAFTMTNAAALDLSTAEFLIEEIRERTATMTFDELPVGPSQIHSPPIDMEGVSLGDDFASFKQVVTVMPVSPADFTTFQSGSDIKKITVRILKNPGNIPINEASWLRANLD